MKNNYQNILIINTGGGLGDALQFVSLFDYINTNINPKNLYYYSNDLENFWFENKIKEYAPSNLITIKNFPEHFGCEKKHKLISKDLIKKFNFEKFDLIIDNQTKLKNSLIYREIPHDQYISPCLNYLFSNPFFLMRKKKHVVLRIIQYLNKILQIEKKIDYKIKIPDIYLQEARRIFVNKNNYIGFSITAGHPNRIKEIEINEIIKVAKYFSKNFIPAFFIEKKFQDLKLKIKTELNNAFFPEEMASEMLQKPMLVTALGNLTKFNITIDNGISHMLVYSKNKTFIFFSKFSEKFGPLSENYYIFDCEKEKISIKNINHKHIINFIEKNIT